MMHQKQHERAATAAGTYAQTESTSQKETFLFAGENRGAMITIFRSSSSTIRIMVNRIMEVYVLRQVALPLSMNRGWL